MMNTEKDPISHEKPFREITAKLQHVLHEVTEIVKSTTRLVADKMGEIISSWHEKYGNLREIAGSITDEILGVSPAEARNRPHVLLRDNVPPHFVVDHNTGNPNLGPNALRDTMKNAGLPKPLIPSEKGQNLVSTLASEEHMGLAFQRHTEEKTDAS